MKDFWTSTTTLIDISWKTSNTYKDLIIQYHLNKSK